MLEYVVQGKWWKKSELMVVAKIMDLKLVEGVVEVERKQALEEPAL